MMELISMQRGYPMWEKVASFAQNCSWRAGPELARQMRERTFLPWECVIAAIVDGEIAGFCTLVHEDELDTGKYPYTPFIGFVFVDEAYRGHRLSEKMIRHALDEARRLGFEKVYIMSGEQGLYEKYGFTRLGVFETIYGTHDQLFVQEIARNT